MTNKIIDPVLRGVLFVFLVITLGLTGSLIADSDRTNPQVNFALFASVFGLTFGVFFGIFAAFVQFLAFPVALVTIDFLDFVFTFAGATALAASIRAHSCGNEVFLNLNPITQGSGDRCRRTQATIAFLYFAFFLTIGQLIVSILSMVSNGAFTRGGRKSTTPRTGVPTMTQV
jgi:hypothetical protein